MEVRPLSQGCVFALFSLLASTRVRPCLSLSLLLFRSRKVKPTVARHPDISDQFVADLNIRFQEAARWVNAVPEGPEKERRKKLATQPLAAALVWCDHGWTPEQILEQILKPMQAQNATARLSGRGSGIWILPGKPGDY